MNERSYMTRYFAVLALVHKRAVLVTLGLLAMLVLSACGGTDTTTPAPTATLSTHTDAPRFDTPPTTTVAQGDAEAFYNNDATDPNRWAPGYVQAEDGSWVPESFYLATTTTTVPPTPTTVPSANPAPAPITTAEQGRALTEDSDGWDWRTQGNGMRGACLNGELVREHADGSYSPHPLAETQGCAYLD